MSVERYSRSAHRHMPLETRFCDAIRPNFFSWAHMHPKVPEPTTDRERAVTSSRKHPRTALVTRPRAPPTGIMWQPLGDRAHRISMLLCLSRVSLWRRWRWCDRTGMRHSRVVRPGSYEVITAGRRRGEFGCSGDGLTGRWRDSVGVSRLMDGSSPSPDDGVSCGEAARRPRGRCSASGCA